MLDNARIRLEPEQHLETRHVLAGAYRGHGRRGSARNLEDRTLLTHSVIVDSAGRDVRTLCGFDPDRLGDSYGETPEGLLLSPTCGRCLQVWERLQQQPNPRKRVGSFGEEKTGVDREAGGRFRAVPKCDFCGKPITGEHYSDPRICGGSDGPGFLLCDRKRCIDKRERYEQEHGLQALADRYTEQRAANEGLAPNANLALRHADTLVQIPSRLDQLQEGDVLVYSGVVADTRHLVRRVERGPRDMVRVRLERLIDGRPDGYIHEIYRRGSSQGYIVERNTEEHSPNTSSYNMANVEADVAAALDHMSDFEVMLDPGEVEVSEPLMVPIGDLEAYDDISGWLELDADADAQELRSFRGSSWANRAATWTSPQRMPPIIIVQTPQASAIADGRGRVNYAIAKGWNEIPAIVVAPRHAPNASYYVWVLSPSGDPLSSEGPYGPYDLEGGKTFARIGAAEGNHDRAVSRGLDPRSPSFEIVRRYRRGTGERAL